MTPAADIQPYLNLWAAALGRNIADMLMPDKPGSRGGRHSSVAGKRRETALDHRQALAWIGTRDFHVVCALAGRDGTRVEAQLRERLEQIAAGTFDPVQAVQDRQPRRRVAQ